MKIAYNKTSRDVLRSLVRGYQVVFLIADELEETPDRRFGLLDNVRYIVSPQEALDVSIHRREDRPFWRKQKRGKGKKVKHI